MTSPAPRHEAIATRLRQEILRGTYRPGDRLPGERDLAARLGVNRGSVREGLRQLEQDGLVDVRHGGGATVRDLEDASLGVVRHMLFVDGHLDAALLEQLLDVHEMLISGAARLTVERAEEDELGRARELLSVLASARSSDDEFMDAIERLLDVIARGSRNLVLRLARNAIDPLFEPRFREARRRFRPPAELIEPIARELTRAIGERDAPAAEEAVRRLLRANRERARGALRALYDAAAPEARRQMEESHGQ